MLHPENRVFFPMPCFSRVTFIRALQSILLPFSSADDVEKVLKTTQDILSPSPATESMIILLKLRAFAARQQSGTIYAFIIVERKSCVVCMRLIINFFGIEVFGHDWRRYQPFTSPPLDSIN